MQYKFSSPLMLKIDVTDENLEVCTAA